MLYLIAFLACLNVVHAHAQCTCPEKQPTDPVPDIVLIAKLVQEEVEVDVKKYQMNGTRFLKVYFCTTKMNSFVQQCRNSV
ncbi:hypothetical protein ANCCAN_09671 [Ancylostoma caninum]|uniref:Uncharacterized protein n=1 Tax=Ancylostoma caninum TaxID=29170 RepID=A0A368GN33_ANCCA|nr:hypothetical protein ANCCAN_09671 [Ancylostoma caninum]